MQKKSKQEERKPRVMRWRGKDMKQGGTRDETGEGTRLSYCQELLHLSTAFMSHALNIWVSLLILTISPEGMLSAGMLPGSS